MNKIIICFVFLHYSMKWTSSDFYFPKFKIFLYLKVDFRNLGESQFQINYVYLLMAWLCNYNFLLTRPIRLKFVIGKRKWKNREKM